MTILCNEGYSVSQQPKRDRSKKPSLPIGIFLVIFLKWLRRDLNLRPWAYESPALTTELLSQAFCAFINLAHVRR